MRKTNEAAAHEILTGPAGLLFFSSIAILVMAIFTRLVHTWV